MMTGVTALIVRVRVGARSWTGQTHAHRPAMRPCIVSTKIGVSALTATDIHAPLHRLLEDRGEYEWPFADL